MIQSATKNANWEVIWKYKGHLVRKDCGTDLPEAIRVYNLAVKADKPSVTLRCKNVGWPPPDKYWRRPTVRKEKVNGRVKKTVVYVSHMNELNRRGLWWCCYCMEFRRFERRKGFIISGVFVPKPVYACPICGVSHQDFHIRNYNPVAARIEASLNLRRRTKGSSRSRRRSNGR